MTVRIRVEPGTQGPAWYYGYIAEHHLLYAKRIEYARSLHTLQGSYNLILDRDEDREIVQVEVLVGPARWQIDSHLHVPPGAPGRVYVIDDIDDGQPQTYFTTPGHTVFYARLGQSRASDDVQHVLIAKEIIVSVAGDGTLVGVWLWGLPAEIAAARRASDRSANRARNGSDV